MLRVMVLASLVLGSVRNGAVLNEDVGVCGCGCVGVVIVLC